METKNQLYRSIVSLFLDYPVTLKQVQGNKWQFEFYGGRTLPGFDTTRTYANRDEAIDYFTGIVHGRAQELAAA